MFVFLNNLVFKSNYDGQISCRVSKIEVDAKTAFNATHSAQLLQLKPLLKRVKM